MGVAWTRLGTVTVTAGSVNVQGVDTRWQTAASIGDAFHGPDGKQYEVAGIISDTALQLRTPYQGVTAAGQAYAIMRIVPQGSDAETMALLRQVLNLTDTQLSAFMAWADSQGIVSISDGETNLVGLHGLRKLMADIVKLAPLASPALTGAPTAPTQASSDASSQLATTAHVLSRVQRSGWHTNTSPVCADLDSVDIVGGVQQVVHATLNNPFGYGMVLTMPRSVSDKTFGQIVMTSTGQLHWRFPSNGSITAWNRVQPTASPVFTGSLSADVLRPASYTRATVPAAGSAGRGIVYVSDAAGGASLAWSDGAGWTSFKTNAAI